MHNLMNLSHSQICDALYEERDVEFDSYMNALEDLNDYMMEEAAEEQENEDAYNEYLENETLDMEDFAYSAEVEQEMFSVRTY